MVDREEITKLGFSYIENIIEIFGSSRLMDLTANCEHEFDNLDFISSRLSAIISGLKKAEIEENAIFFNACNRLIRKIIELKLIEIKPEMYCVCHG